MKAFSRKFLDIQYLVLARPLHFVGAYHRLYHPSPNHFVSQPLHFTLHKATQAGMLLPKASRHDKVNTLLLQWDWKKPLRLF